MRVRGLKVNVSWSLGFAIDVEAQRAGDIPLSVRDAPPVVHLSVDGRGREHDADDRN
jgi:hypothetical protein